MASNRSNLWAYVCLLGTWSCSGPPENSLDSDQLARASQCANLDENACTASADCQPAYEGDPNTANGSYSGCEPSDPLGCENVSCPVGYQCIEGIAGPVCVSTCNDPAGCACVFDDGVAVPPGSSFPSPDGCNTCTCDPSGQIVCTEIACGCPLDFVCADGSIPAGPNCECPSHGCCDNVACPPGHHCEDSANGPACVPDCDATDPNGCVCPAIVCPDGTTPVAPDCECAPPLSCANVLCAPGTHCVETSGGPQCISDCDPNTGEACGCPLDFICPDGSQPQGPGCECPPACDAAGQACECVAADGTSVPPGTTFPAPDGCNVCVCGSDGQVACTELACPNGG